MITMMSNLPAGLKPSLASGARIHESVPGTWRLELPSGERGVYHLAQLDDYRDRSRGDFRWRESFQLTLEARASAARLPGTWGFGLWNDPFSMSILGGGGRVRLPALPNTAWFFFASEHNYLSLRDDLPACGTLAAVFRSPRWPPALLAPGALGLPLLLFPPLARLLRRLGSRIVEQAAVELTIDPRQWHRYDLAWRPGAVEFRVDRRRVLETRIAPHGPLGFVLWLDNQFAAFSPNGKVRYGVLPVADPSWIEIRELRLTS